MPPLDEKLNPYASGTVRGRKRRVEGPLAAEPEGLGKIAVFLAIVYLPVVLLFGLLVFAWLRDWAAGKLETPY